MSRATFFSEEWSFFVAQFFRSAALCRRISSVSSLVCCLRSHPAVLLSKITVPFSNVVLPSCLTCFFAIVCFSRDPDTIMERTYIMIKPDGVQRHLVGSITSRFEQKGYKLVALKLWAPPRDFMESHYEDLKDKGFFGGLIDYMVSGPVVSMVWEGVGVVKEGRKMLGATKPSDSAPGTIRGDYCVEVGRNICHGSDSVESANREIELWFPEGVTEWNDSQQEWVYEAGR